jgi:hypothetical protein
MDVANYALILYYSNTIKFIVIHTFVKFYFELEYLHK